MDAAGPVADATRTRKHLARLALVAFILTFIAARVLVYLIMSRRVPDLYFYVGQTHVHHLNYGIFLLSAVGAWLLFGPRTARHVNWCALLYGVGLGLTFDEFGMWLHLGGPYWQQLSIDAVVVVAAVLTLIAMAPSWRDIRGHDWAVGACLLLALAGFVVTMFDTLKRSRLVPELERLEQRAPQ